jgi:hypothetical protein
VFLAIDTVVGLFLFASMIRRGVILRERLNTFWIMAIQMTVWVPTSIAYYALYLDRPSSHHHSPYEMSITNWYSYITLGNTFCPLIVAWLQLSKSKRLTARRINRQWPLPLIIAAVIFNLGTQIGAVLAGSTKYYKVGMRLVTATWCVYLWICSICLFIGGWRIKTEIHSLATASTASRASLALSAKKNHESFRSDIVSAGKHGHDETSEPAAATTSNTIPSNPNDVTMHVTNSINRILGVVVCGLFLPASIATALHCVFLEYIDKHVWATQLVWNLYRFCATVYVAFWAILFWVETSYKHKSRSEKSGHRVTTPSHQTNESNV